MLAEEARIEPARLRELGLRDGLVDAAIEVLATRRVGDRAVEAEFHASASAARRNRPQRLQVRVLVRLVEHQTDLLRARVEEALDLVAALPGGAEDGHGVDH